MVTDKMNIYASKISCFNSKIWLKLVYSNGSYRKNKTSIHFFDHSVLLTADDDKPSLM